MVAPAKGSAIQLYMAKESAYGVDPGTGYVSFSAASFSLPEDQPFLPVDLLGQGRDQDRPERDVVTTQGSMRLPVERRIIGHVMNMALGTAATQNDTPSPGLYTHTWESGADVLPSYTMVAQMPDAAGTPHFLGLGVQANGFTVRFESTGRAYIEVALQAKSFSLVQSDHAGVPTAPEFERYGQIDGRVLLDDVKLGKLIDFELPFTNNNELVRYVGDAGAIGDILPGLVGLQGNMNVLYEPSAINALFTHSTALTTFDLKAQFGIAQDYTTKLLSFHMPQAEVAKPSTPIEGPGGIRSTFPYVGSADKAGATPSLEVVLVNDVASY